MIDRNLRPEWPGDVSTAVARFKQGDLVERPPFFYAGVARYGIWSLTLAGGQGESDSDVEVFELDTQDGEPPYGLITTQTCDLNEQRARPRQPWFQLAPVYNADHLDANVKASVERRMIGHLVKLSGRSLPQGFWVADLRIEMPVEKSWLVGRQPIESFGNEASYLDLAERLAGRRMRPALANIISDQIVKPLRDAFGRLGRGKKASLLDPIKEIRLFCSENRLAPKSAQILIITKEDPPPNQVEQWFNDWWDRIQAPTVQAGLALLANRYETMDKLTALEYVSSIPLDFDYLSPEE